MPIGVSLLEMSKDMSIEQLVLAASGAFVCPAPFIGLYDYCNRTAEFEAGGQVMGFLLGMALAIPWSFVAMTLSLPMLANDGEPTTPGEAPRPRGLRWSAIPLATALYAAIGFVVFRGQMFDNTLFYLASRFSPYFFALLLCTLAAMRAASFPRLRAVASERARDCAPFVAIAVVWAEKLAFGRISSLDLLFAPAFAAILAAVAALRIRKGRAQASPGS